MLYRRSISRFIPISLALLGLSVSSVNAAAILNLSGGQLLGASGVDVDGRLYDVDFVDGTCIAVFTGCDDATDFTFRTSEEAALASAALFVQVFIDSGLGTFNTNPDLTVGCINPFLCSALTAYGQANPPENLLSATAWNFFDSNDNITLTGLEITYDLGNSDSQTFARWAASPVSVVPVPAAVWLFGTALIGLFGFGKRKSRITA